MQVKSAISYNFLMNLVHYLLLNSVYLLHIAHSSIIDSSSGIELIFHLKYPAQTEIESVSSYNFGISLLRKTNRQYKL